MDAFRAAGLPAGPCNDARDLFLDPQVKARGLYEMVELAPEANGGTRPLIGRAFVASETKFKVQRPAPPLGEANEYVFKEILGLTDQEFADLEADKITGKRPPVDEPETGLPIDALLGVRRIRIHDADYKKVIGI